MRSKSIIIYAHVISLIKFFSSTSFCLRLCHGFFWNKMWSIILFKIKTISISNFSHFLCEELHLHTCTFTFCMQTFSFLRAPPKLYMDAFPKSRTIPFCFRNLSKWKYINYKYIVISLYLRISRYNKYNRR